MSENNKGFWAIVGRELKIYLQEPVYLFCIIGIPLFCYIFFTSLMKQGVPEQLPIAVVDHDQTPTSRNLIRTLDAMSSVHVQQKLLSFTEAREAMQRGEIYAFLEIPEDFAARASSGKQPELAFFSNDAFYVAGVFSFKALKTSAALANGAVVKTMLSAKGLSEKEMAARLMPTRLDVHPLGNPWTSYSIYLNNVLLPAVVELMIFLMTVFTLGMEIKRQQSRRLLIMGNRSILRVVLAKLFPQTLLFIMMIMLLNTYLYGYLGFPIKSGILPMASASVLFVLACQAMGILFICIFPMLRLAMSAASLTGALGFSIAGFSLPVPSMYEPFQWLSHLFPIRHYFMIYSGQALNGVPLYYSLHYYLALAIILIVPFLLLPRLKQAYVKQCYKL